MGNERCTTRVTGDTDDNDGECHWCAGRSLFHWRIWCRGKRRNQFEQSHRLVPPRRDRAFRRRNNSQWNREYHTIELAYTLFEEQASFSDVGRGNTDGFAPIGHCSSLSRRENLPRFSKNNARPEHREMLFTCRLGLGHLFLRSSSETSPLVSLLRALLAIFVHWIGCFERTTWSNPECPADNPTEQRWAICSTSSDAVQAWDWPWWRELGSNDRSRSSRSRSFRGSGDSSPCRGWDWFDWIDAGRARSMQRRIECREHTDGWTG